jgi:hypothetical protein
VLDQHELQAPVISDSLIYHDSGKLYYIGLEQVAQDEEETHGTYYKAIVYIYNLNSSSETSEEIP